MPNCKVCDIEFSFRNTSLNIYCSNKCQGQEKSLAVLNSYLNNQIPETFYEASFNPRKAIRKYFIKKYNCKCVKCGWGESHPNSLLPALELDHIDGNWKNCLENNIRTICPNCHSLTDSWKARNRGNGREHRRW